MQEIVTWAMGMLEKGAKGFWGMVFIVLLIIPFGIPILIAVGLYKAWRNKR